MTTADIIFRPGMYLINDANSPTLVRVERVWRGLAVLPDGSKIRPDGYRVGRTAILRWREATPAEVDALMQPSDSPLPEIPRTLTPEAARAVLARVTARDVRSREHDHGIAWTMTLALDGVPALLVAQAGRGGANTYRPPSGDLAAARWLETLLGRAAAALGLGDIAPLDTLTAAMVEGATGLDGVAASLAYSAEYDAEYGGGS